MRLGLAVLVLTTGACSGGEDDLPEAPAMCQQPLTLMTPWWSGYGSSATDCTDPSLTRAALGARAGVVYYGGGISLCAVDAIGIRPVASTAVPGEVPGLFDTIQGLWVDGDRVIYTDGYTVRAVPAAGGAETLLFAFTADDAPRGGAYAFDGTFLYWGLGDGHLAIRRRTVAGGDSTPLVGPSGMAVQTIQVAGNRLDYTVGDSFSIGPLARRSLSDGTMITVDLSGAGALLASAGDLTYVRYAPHGLGSGAFDDGSVDIGVVDSGGGVRAAWIGHLPHIMPSAGLVQGSTLYAGGRLHYHGGAEFVGVTAQDVGGSTAEVLGCSPSVLAPVREWPQVLSIAADETGTYALIETTDARAQSQFAIARFPAR